MLFQDSPLPMVVFDAETFAYLAVNAAAEELYGYTREEFLKLTLRDTRPAEQVPGLLDFLKSVETADAYRNTFTSQRKDGQLLMIDARTRTIQFGGRRVRLALITDITEQKRLESQLQQAQKMEAVGRLAGGIAHDFNNLLTVILGYSSSILQKLDEKDPLRSKVSEIETAGQRAANLTSQLLAFSRKQILQPQTLELNTVVSNIGQMLRRLLGEDIQIALHLDGALGQIQADPTQLEQVLVNMAVNARDAMPHGGQLVIETHNTEVSRELAFAPGIPPGPYVVLVVTDTGCGMDEATKARVFEPFFTTKEVGKGTGLGLSMALGVVQQSGGTVTVYSELGIGTTFRIYLPRWNTPTSQAEGAGESKTLPPGEGATILLVEDEGRVRTLAREVLSDAGYAVSEASNGKEALKIAESSIDAPALVLTDVVMPEMSGPELADMLRKKWPRLPIVFTSGYTDHALLVRSALQRDTPFLQKPYTPVSLLEQVAGVLKPTSRPTVLVGDDNTNIRQTSSLGLRDE
jgi:two-component system, cell cycle sensor histidine kinase and response regulator CckA